MRLKRLNVRGLEAMVALLDAARAGRPYQSPADLIGSADLVEPLKIDVEIVDRRFANRRELGEYLHAALAQAEPGIRRDPGAWGFLALAWFDQLCEGGRGHAKVGAVQRWIPSLDDARRYYRHLLLGPYLVYSAHVKAPEAAMALLCQPISTPGEVVEQFVSRPELVTSAPVVALATALYYDPKTGKIKRGAGGKGPGSARRLADVLTQLVLTYDLQSSSGESLKQLLPKEFDRYSKRRWFS